MPSPSTRYNAQGARAASPAHTTHAHATTHLHASRLIVRDHGVRAVGHLDCKGPVQVANFLQFVSSGDVAPLARRLAVDQVNISFLLAALLREVHHHTIVLYLHVALLPGFPIVAFRGKTGRIKHTRLLVYHGRSHEAH